MTVPIIPQILLDQIGSGSVILFLGAGASRDAIHKLGKQAPSGQDLADMLAKKFLGDNFVGRPLTKVAEISISETNLFTVQEFIADIVKEFHPADFHRIIPHIPWRAIAGTNYDLIIERSYQEVSDRLQQPVVFKKDGEHVDQKLRSNADVIYLKLHGCITDINDPDLPLILTPEQYITHRKHRRRLFERLQELAYEYPILFVGYGIDDLDIRQILLELSELKDGKQRSYLINPVLTPQEIRFWESQRVSGIPITFKDFLNIVDQSLGTLRGLGAKIAVNGHPITRRFVNANVLPAESLVTLLNRDVEYVYTETPISTVEPSDFYKGYFADWTPIEMKLDVKRYLTDDILSEVFLTTEVQKQEKQELVIIKGYAGAGKTVMLRRLAWDAGRDFKKLCLYVNGSARPEYDALFELHVQCQERIFLFFDHANESKSIIERLMQRAKKDKLPLTIIAAERHNEWEAYCDDLEPFVTSNYDIKNLTRPEIEQLVNLLEKHKSLGHLKGLTFEEQVKSLETHYGRQLLVALHEATLGKPFSDIVYDEYKSIPSTKAQVMYLTVCILHRLGVVTRAGIISRIHGVAFQDFKENLFRPLHSIVFARENKILNDFDYTTRHPHIAQEVFERALVQPQDRFDEYVRILDALDIDYNSDRDAFRRMTNARELLELFPNQHMIRQIYDIARTRALKDEHLMQQEAIFEMSAHGGSLEKAMRLLQEAQRIAPWSNSIEHSLAELAFRRSELEDGLECLRLRQEARLIAQRLVNKKQFTSHAYHTLIKLGLADLRDAINLGNEGMSDRKVKELEETISKADQAFPGDEFILSSKAQFNTIIENAPEALVALEKAFSTNKRSPFIALRLSTTYLANNRTEDALHVLEECLNQNPSNKDIHFRIAELLMNDVDANQATILYHLRRSFTKGDSNFHAQFLYARMLYVKGDLVEANEYFTVLRTLNVDVRLKREPRAPILKNGIPEVFLGTITRREASWAFIKRDGFNDDIFAYCPTRIAGLETYQRVNFEVCFNYRGPTALNLVPESRP